MYLFKGAKSLSEKTAETVFTALMLFGAMKWAMRNTKKSVVQVLPWLKKIRRFFSRYSSLRTLWRNMLRKATSRAPHWCLSDRFAPSRRHRKSGLLLDRLWSLIHVHRSQKRSNAFFLKQVLVSSTQQQILSTSLLHFLRPVSPDHTDFVRKFEPDGYWKGTYFKPNLKSTNHVPTRLWTAKNTYRKLDAGYG